MRRGAVLIFVLLLTGAAAAGLWIAGDRLAPRAGMVTTTGEARIGGPFSLTDQFGHARSERDFGGRYLIVYFGYTNCPDVCPTSLSVIADALEKMGGAAARVTPVFITVDPARDTPAVLKSYLSAFGKEFIGLTGPEKDIEKVAKEYHAGFRRFEEKGGNYPVEHSNIIYFMNPEGKFIAEFDETLGPEKLAAALINQMN